MSGADVPRNTILVSDVLDRLRELPDGCVQTVVTSPPYWGLRDYGVAGQIGLEPTPAAFVARMVEVFREVRRVLRDDGTCWLNLGDTYFADSPIRDRSAERFADISPVKRSAGGARRGCASVEGLKPKDLCGIPWRVAFALQDDGWYLRSDIIWSKPNPMPESVTDRPTRAHEYIFLLSKRARYYYDADAVREPMAPESAGRYAYAFGGAKNKHLKATDKPTAVVGIREVTAGRNKRSVWTVATEAFPDAHFATFPRKLIEPCILAGTSPQACEHCGAPWVRIVEAQGGTIGKSWHDHKGDLQQGQRVTDASGKGYRVGDAPGYRRVERGWRPSCHCDGNTGAGRCIVLDPFGGSGTTALVAQQWQRDWLLIELNPSYVEMAQRRLSVVPVRLFAEGEASA